MTTIKISKEASYLSDVMTNLPTNCIFDKGKVGCGGTTVALTNDINYVVCVPFVSLIQNKVSQLENVLGIYAGIPAKEIKDYLASTGTKKIMVTYDSLPRLLCYINPKDYSLLVDEYHLLFTQYSFRKDAALSVLGNYKRFNTFCFMTATVLENDFILNELKDIPKVVAEWETVKEVTVHSVKCKHSVLKTTIALVNRFLNNEIEGNAYIFVNSVEFIKKLKHNCNLNDNNTRAIWSANNKMETGLRRGLTTDEPKKINLLTSTCFEGADLYDENGKIYIVSDNSKSHTLVDISTSFQQIAGRVRNTRYASKIVHIYTSTRYDVDVTYEEYKLITEQGIVKAHTLVDECNTAAETLKSYLDDNKLESSYVVRYGNFYEFDENLVRVDLYNFKITKNLYKLRINLVNEYVKNGFKVMNHNDSTDCEVAPVEDIEMNFEEVVNTLKEYFDENATEYDDDFIKDAYVKYPFLEEAIKKLGFEGIEAEEYVITNIKRKMINVSSIQEQVKILKHLKLNSNIITGTFISAATAKRVMVDIYDSLDIKKAAKGSDLGTYYEIKEASKRINNIVVKGYTIIREKITINN